jgi:hypothetical protein
VKAACSLFFLGENVMKRYKCVLDRLINSNATFTAIPSKINDT